MSRLFTNPRDALRHHVSGAIERGEAQAITEQPSPRCAFDRAIAAGRLSADPVAANYAGRYMYMGPARGGRDAFKHSETREYLP